MLDDNSIKLKQKKGILGSKKVMPKLSLRLHVMPQTSETSLEKWIVWGVLILFILIVVSYFLFK